jgi:hypothetical protein
VLVAGVDGVVLDPRLVADHAGAGRLAEVALLDRGELDGDTADVLSGAHQRDRHDLGMAAANASRPEKSISQSRPPSGRSRVHVPQVVEEQGPVPVDDPGADAAVAAEDDLQVTVPPR